MNSNKNNIVMSQHADDTFTIGRDTEKSDVVVYYPFVSSVHVKVKHTQDEQILIADWGRTEQGSTRGTYVRGDSEQESTRNTYVRLPPREFVPVNPDDEIWLAEPPRGYPLRLYGLEVRRFDSQQITIGRERGCDVPLTNPYVSARHATIFERNGVYYIRDDDPASGTTYVNNRLIEDECELTAQDVIHIASVQLRFNPVRKTLAVFASGGSYLSVRDIVKVVPDSASPNRQKTLLDRISFEVKSGDFVGLIGPSGAGKSTLLKALCGIVPPDAGDVSLDRENFYRNYELFKMQIGYAPQDDIAHHELTVEESLHYTARLRFAHNMPKTDRTEYVNTVLNTLHIEKTRHTLIGSISGGQRKRVNLAQELLNPAVNLLFLDEPTSGLDPNTDAEVMQLLRDLAKKDNRTIIVVTHNITTDNIKALDNVVILKEGKLVYHGAAQDTLAYFEVEHPAQIFEKLEDKHQTASDWEAQFQAHCCPVAETSQFQHLEDETPDFRSSERARLAPFWHQLWVLISRYARVKSRDTANLTVLLVQPLLIAIFLLLLFEHVTVSFLFILCFSALWFGCSSSVREFISERAIFRRERMVNLRLSTYILSKVAVLTVIGCVQCLTLIGIFYLYTLIQRKEFALFDPRHDFIFYQLFSVLLMTCLAGIAMGLLISAIFPSTEAAFGALLIFLIPQILYSGIVLPFRLMPAPWVSDFTICRWSLEAAVKSGKQLKVYEGKPYYEWKLKEHSFILREVLLLSDDTNVSLPYFKLKEESFKTIRENKEPVTEDFLKKVEERLKDKTFRDYDRFVEAIKEATQQEKLKKTTESVFERNRQKHYPHPSLWWECTKNEHERIVVKNSNDDKYFFDGNNFLIEVEGGKPSKKIQPSFLFFQMLTKITDNEFEIKPALFWNSILFFDNKKKACGFQVWILLLILSAFAGIFLCAAFLALRHDGFTFTSQPLRRIAALIRRR